MSVNLAQKKQLVAGVAEVLATAQTIVLAEVSGISANNMNAVRAQARALGVYLRVLKNTLAKKAVSETKFKELTQHMSQQLVYAISDDPIAAAKIIYEFAQNNEQVKIVAGMYNETILNEQAVKRLATIPSREVLLAQILGVMQQIPASFVRLVAAIKVQKEAQN